jgi:hypothetical protein
VKPAAARLVHAFLDGGVEKLFFVGEGHWSWKGGARAPLN